jgi:TonB family protein
MTTTLLALPLGALLWAAAPDGGVPAPPGLPDAGLVRHELEVTRTDAGFQVGAELAPDAGPSAPPVAQLVPPQLLEDAPAQYPEALAGSGLSADVVLDLLVDEQGEVAEVALAPVEPGGRPVAPEFAAAALHAASRLRFSPARLEDQPVAVRISFTYRFRTAPATEPEKAPSGTLKGLVRTRGNRRPIAGATLSFRDGGTAETSPDGRFEVELPPGPAAVTVSAPGHVPARFRERVKAGESVEVLYGLEPLIVNPYETIVRGESERTEVSRITLHEEELREVPGTMGDPFRVVMLLPGVSSVVSGVAYPVVRGSQPAATGYFLDGIRVPLLFHLLLGPAVVHPDFIDSVDFYPGAPPVKYGRLMGGAIDGKITRPREDRIHATAYADLINAGAFFEAPFEPTGTNVSVAGRFSYTAWLLAALVGAISSAADEPVEPRLDFWDYQLRLEQKIGAGRLRLFTFGSSDIVGFRVSSDDPQQRAEGQQEVTFHRVDLRYRGPVGPGELEVGATWGTDRLGFGGGAQGFLFQYLLHDETYAARATYEFPWPLLPDTQVRLGLDVEHRRPAETVTGRLELPEMEPLDLKIQNPVALGTFVGAYWQSIWTGAPGWTVVPGLRVDNYHLVPGIDHLAFEPRLTLRYELTPQVVLKGGAGVFHMPPTQLINLPASSTGNLRFGIQEGVQLDTGVEWKVFDGVEVNADVYFNPIFRQLELNPFEGLQGLLFTMNPNETEEERAARLAAEDARIRGKIGDGYAYGFELMIRHPLGGNWFGWLSYSLQRSVRRRVFETYGAFNEPNGTRRGYVPFEYDQTHVLNGVISYKFPGGWTAGVSVHFNTGLPETGVGFTSQTHRSSRPPGLDRDIWVRVPLDEVDRMPPFFRLDARVAKSWAFDTFTMELYFDMLNATLSREVIRWNYVEAGPTGMLEKEAVENPVAIPILGLKGAY